MLAVDLNRRKMG